MYEKNTFFLIVIASTNAKSQSNNTISYSADLISQEMIQNQFTDSQRVIFNKALGVDVLIVIDTVFKKYTIGFTDENSQNVAMILRYKRNYFLGIGEELAKRNKQYLMEFQGEEFYLNDAIEQFPYYGLIITFEEPFPNNCILSYRVKNLKRITSK